MLSYLVLLYRYLFTIKDLKFVQIFWRLKYIIKRKSVERKSDVVTKKYRTIANSKGIVTNSSELGMLNKRLYKHSLKDVIEGKFCFLNKTKTLGSINDLSWTREDIITGTRLWKLNLHYMEFLYDLAVEYRNSNDISYLNAIRAITKDWIKKNPIGTKDYGKDNWNSYALSMRIPVWIRVFKLLENHMDEKFKDEYLFSLRMQCEFLKDNLELDLLGNHLFKDWKALKFSAWFFCDDEYNIVANKLFEKYIKKQFSNDGMHEEMSPMYLGLSLEDLLEIYQIDPDESLKRIITKGINSLYYLSNGNDYLFFNDSINNNGPEPKYLFQIAKGLGIEPDQNTIFNIDGYTGLKNENIHLAFDSAPLVYGNQFGHVHSDCLSFEIYLKGKKLITNLGVFEYDPTIVRKYQRSARAHNTVWLRKTDQSDNWGSFRVGRKAKVISSNILKLKDSIRLEGSIKGFSLLNPVIHSRGITIKDKGIQIKDKVLNLRGRKGGANIHIGSDFGLKEVSKFKFEVCDKLDNRVAIIETTLPGKLFTNSLSSSFGKKTTIDSLTIPISNIENDFETKIKFDEKCIFNL